MRAECPSEGQEGRTDRVIAGIDEVCILGARIIVGYIELRITGQSIEGRKARPQRGKSEEAGRGGIVSECSPGWGIDEKLVRLRWKLVQLRWGLFN